MEGTVPSSIQPPPRGRNIIASHRRRRRFDDEADRIHKHVCPVQHRRDLVGAVGVRPWCDFHRLTSSYVHRGAVLSH